MNQTIEKLKIVGIGTFGNITTPEMLRVHVYQGEESGKLYGLIVDHCRSGDDQKTRKIMFNSIDNLIKIADEMNNEQKSF